MIIKVLQAISFKNCFLFSLILFFNCQNQTNNTALVNNAQAEIITIKIPKTQLVLKPNIGLVYLQDKPFNGTSILKYNNNTIAEAIDYKNGIKNGVFKKWFEDGTLSFEAFYANGQLHGVSKSWWSNGNLRSESNYINGKANGIQKQWYVSGQKFKLMTLVNGKEEGMQQAWRRNGKIYNNYQAKNGRIFGLKRANLCFQLEEEIVQDEKL